jgi:hypothetical protein
MGTSRSFRFGVLGERCHSAEALRARVRRAEDLGYATLLLRDHFPDRLLEVFASVVTRLTGR